MILWNVFYGRRIRTLSGVVIAFSIIVALAALDLFVGKANYPVGYILALVALAPLCRRRLLYGTVIGAAFLNYAIYFAGPWVRGHPRQSTPHDFRILNRTLPLVVMVGAAVIFDARARYINCEKRDLITQSRPIRSLYLLLDTLFLRLSHLSMPTLVLLNFAYFGGVAFADFLAPPQFNLAILYIFAISLCACTRHRVLLWTLVLLTLILTRLGFTFGMTTVEPERFSRLVLGRVLVRVVVVALAAVTAPWLAWQEIDRQSGPTPPDPDPKFTPSNIAVKSCNPNWQVTTHFRPRKRILYLDHTAAIGGGEIALLNLLQHLDRTVYDPVVVLFSEGPLTALSRNSDIETHILPLSRAIVNTRKESLRGWGLMRFAALGALLAHVGRLVAFIRAGKYDLIHTNSLKSDIIGGMAGRITGRTVLWHVRDRVDADYLPAIAVAGFRAACCLLADFVVTNSKATMELLHPTLHDVFGRAAADERMRVVHDGVIHGAFLDLPPAAKIRSIGLVGRISPFKGQDIFIRSAANVLECYPDCHFKIIGAALFNEDGYEREIRQLVRDLNLEQAVEFTGFRSDVVEAISELDVLVHASVTGEPFGQVIVEGMAAGKPVVATNGGGVPEIVENGVTGFLVPMRDSNALTDAICELVSDRDKAVQMGLRGQQRVREHFRIENTAAKMDSLYKAIFAHRRRRGASMVAFARESVPASMGAPPMDHLDGHRGRIDVLSP